MAAGYASESVSDALCVSVRKLSGETFTLQQLTPYTCGDELWKMMQGKCATFGSPALPVLSIEDRLVTLDASLKDQSIKHGDELTLTFRAVTEAEQNGVAKKLCSGRDDLNSQEVFIWHSTRTLVWSGNTHILIKYGWPIGLRSLSFHWEFNHSIDEVSLPAGLQSLRFGLEFNQSMDEVSLPAGLQSLTFGLDFRQSMDKVSLPAGLQSLTFGYYFNQSMEKVTLPAGLQSLTFGGGFNQSMDKVTLPVACQVNYG